VIVAQVTSLNQFGGIAPTTLLTPATNGVYRVSAYMTELLTKKLSGSYSLNVGWVDESGHVQFTPATWVTLPAQGGTVGAGYRFASGTAIIRGVAGKPISYTVQGFAPNFNYNLFITVEQLEID
jgi:hypothetical protein